MTAVAGRLILNEILNSDYRDLSERIEKNPDAISTVGVCGESPAHIAIYKNDAVMLKMLLDAGTSPNLVNSGGDSLVHVAARLGYIDLLRLLYDTKKCILILKNKINQTAVDIARSEVELSNLHVLKLFAEYKYGEPNEKEQLFAVRLGRKKCAEFLAEKMIYDREQKVRNMVQETLDVTNDRRNKARILRGVGGTKYTTFYTDLTYNTNINKQPWENVDMDFFVNYTEGLDKIVRAAFACDYVNKSIRVGFQNVLTDMKLKSGTSTYPVPTAEALIPHEIHVEPVSGNANSNFRPHLMTVQDADSRARVTLQGNSRSTNMPVLGHENATVSGKAGGGISAAVDSAGSTGAAGAAGGNGGVSTKNAVPPGVLLSPIVHNANSNSTRSSTALGNVRRVSIHAPSPQLANRQSSAPTLLQPLVGARSRNAVVRANTGTLNSSKPTADS